MNSWKTKQANNNLNRADYLLAFAQYYPYGPDYYIFGGMYRVEKIMPEVFDQPGYKLTLLADFQDYRKRLIIKFLLSHKDLQTIVKMEVPEWKMRLPVLREFTVSPIKQRADYIIENFTYSILEIFGVKTKREDIIQREEFWKKVFQSVMHGMNN